MTTQVTFRLSLVAAIVVPLSAQAQCLPKALQVGGDLALRLPFQTGEQYRVSQGYCGSSHVSGYEVDFALPNGTTVVAAAAGTVVEVGDYANNCPTGCGNAVRNAGIYVKIRHQGTANLWFSSYLHLSQRLVNVNDSVVAGEPIGYSGNSGWASGYHLHFHIRSSVVGDHAYGVRPTPMHGVVASSGATSITDFVGNEVYRAIDIPVFPAPRISNVNGNDQVAGSSARQWITINGSAFREGFTAVFRNITDGQSYPEITDRTRLEFVRSDQVRVFAGVGDSISTWGVVIKNADGQASNERQFLVTNVDNTAPRISMFAVAPSSVALGNYFTISYAVSDTGGSGLRQVVLWRANVDGLASDPSWRPIRTNTAAGNGPVNGNFSDAPPATGTYWYGLHAVDNSGNDMDERTAGVGPDQVRVEVDFMPPSISAFSVAPPSVILGNAFSISYTVSDTGGSGLIRVELWRASGNGSATDASWRLIKTNAAAANGPVSGIFIDAPSVPGTYWYGLHAVDNAGNLMDERTAGVGPDRATVNEVCVASLIAPVSGAVISGVPAFRWSISANCSNKVYLATNTASGLTLVFSNMFYAGLHTLVVDENRWAAVVGRFGAVSTYYWTVGSADINDGTAFAEWQSFSIAPIKQFVDTTLSESVFRFVLNGIPGDVYVVQASSNLVNWTSLSTNQIPDGGSLPMADPSASTQRRRFYRAAKLP